jgi:hypothetical protein
MSRNMRSADARAASVRRLEGTHPTAMPATTMAATMAAEMPAAAGVCFECEKRHDEEQHRRNASAGLQHRTRDAAELGTPPRRGRLRSGTPPRTNSL